MTRICEDCGKPFEGTEKARYCKACRERRRITGSVQHRQSLESTPALNRHQMAAILRDEAQDRRRVSIGTKLALAIADALDEK